MTPRSHFTMVVAALLVSTAAHAQQASVPIPSPRSDTDLAGGFENPPMSARPVVWWHWMNGNITQDGIRKDLAWMQRAGIGGVQNFDAALTTPTVVDKRIIYMTSDWKDAFRLAVRTADAMGFDFGIAASPGWSESGGPWVKPADAMKKLVWSRTELVGGQRFSGVLAAPPRTTGTFQTLGKAAPLPGSPAAEGEAPTYYADVAVLAYPIATEAPLGQPIVQSAGKPLDGTALSDGRPETAAGVAPGTSAAPGDITLAYPKAQTVRSATFFQLGGAQAFGTPLFLPVLEARDGSGWRRIATFPIAQVPTTISFAPVTAREFRLLLTPNTSGVRQGSFSPAPGVDMGSIFGGGGLGGGFGRAAASVQIGEFALSGDARIDRFEAKAGFSTVPDYHVLSRDVPDVPGVDPAKIVDLTDKMRRDGTLDWTPPKGRWQVLRLGTSLLGTTNHPATPEATGLEVDKYDREAVRRYFTTYLGMYRDTLGDNLIGRHGLRTITTDSIESGDANWTPKMIEQFKRLRGYDPVPFLPALAGVVIGSRSRSDQFLYDYRQTLADLIASEHYGTIADIAHANGLKVFGEALENGRPQLGDDIAMRSHADVPMAAMWTYPKDAGADATYIGDIRGAASVSHVYGRGLVAAESLTAAFSPYAFAPSDLKRVIDLEFVHGINRPIIHSSVHQPLDDKQPGLTLAIFGQYFNRHETWADMARPWIDYIARNSYMLQQGRNVADVAYFFGEDAPLTSLYTNGSINDVPTQYGYDFVNRDILLKELSVDNGEIVSKGGARYRVLYLSGQSDRMTLAALRSIAALADAGATIVGTAPVASPALADDRAQYAALVKRLWPGTAVTSVGRGRVIAGKDLERALDGIGIAADVTFIGGQVDKEIPFVHRALADGDVYFLNNRRQRAETVQVSFRVAGRVPELWRAETGKAESLSYRIENGRTVVPLTFGSEDAFYVVFRKAAAVAAAKLPAIEEIPLATLTDPWTISFEPGRGAPPSTTMKTLVPLDQSTEAGIKYFSGIATYTNTFDLSGNVMPARRVILDLGRVGEIAEVQVNGKAVGTVWHAPFRLDIGRAAKRGRNTISVKVANLWVNRLIGDAQPGAAKVAFTSGPGYQPNAPLRPSGLIGPVSIFSEMRP